jgi:hypothetical protein
MRDHYESVKPGAGGSVSVTLTPLELIERLAGVIPPPPRQAAEPQEADIRFSRARMALVGRRLPVGAAAAKRPFADMRSLSSVCFPRTLGTAAPGQEPP